ncbi:MAG: hypothetical protein PHS53_02120 [Candidatus Pacebacteria bacterium]|nr:hypothetical protein [Candidatus Paceibacterota bacterium]MDD5356921.1 hypothetical protein [Candidatus Paceibacterota bacterium]
MKILYHRKKKSPAPYGAGLFIIIYPITSTPYRSSTPFGHNFRAYAEFCLKRSVDVI